MQEDDVGVEGAAMVNASEWYEKFLLEFEKAAKDPSTEIGIHYEKYRVRQTETEQEWTYTMGVFLARLARKMGYFQEWTRLDFKWFEEDRMTPVAAMEHENDYTAKIGSSEIPKLLRSRAPLKILITYREDSEVEDVLEEAKSGVIANIEKAKHPFEFLLIVGGYLDNPSDWDGFIWDEQQEDWMPVPSPSLRNT